MVHGYAIMQDSCMIRKQCMKWHSMAPHTAVVDKSPASSTYRQAGMHALLV